VAYNVLSVVKAALRSVHGAKVVTEEVSGYYLADEVAGTYRGMMIAIPEDEWAVFQDLSPVERVKSRWEPGSSGFSGLFSGRILSSPHHRKDLGL
jgi:hypothetical protein